jgi:hypothetical protein
MVPVCIIGNIFIMVKFIYFLNSERSSCMSTMDFTDCPGTFNSITCNVPNGAYYILRADWCLARFGTFFRNLN